MKATGTIFTVELVALPGWSAPGHQRLARFLKLALRGFGLRCVRIAQVQSAALSRDEGADSKWSLGDRHKAIRRPGAIGRYNESVRKTQRQPPSKKGVRGSLPRLMES